MKGLKRFMILKRKGLFIRGNGYDNFLFIIVFSFLIICLKRFSFLFRYEGSIKKPFSVYFLLFLYQVLFL